MNKRLFETAIAFTCIVLLTGIGFAAEDRSTTQLSDPIGISIAPAPPSHKSQGHISGDPLTLTETVPPEKLTESALEAIDYAPDWLREELADNLARMSSANQDVYADMILNPSDPRFTDEIAFCVAEVAAEILEDTDFIPDLLEENVFYVYEHDQYLDYVRLVDTGQPGVDDDYYTTTYYNVEESGVTTEYELDREIYYWFIVHPKIEDEMVDYIDPDSQDQHADPPVGVFWRDWLFTYTEEIPETDDNYPILRDQFAGVDVLWKSQGGIDNGAVGIVTQWVLDTLDFTSGAERPHQPVRIYKLHVGRCGEHQDYSSAACRACLIPCLNTEAVGEDHVWNEFWDRRWIHWEPVNVYVDAPLTYENGWGKKFSGVLNVRGDGLTWDVIDRYSEGYCTLNVLIEDANHDPIDGAKLNVKRGGWVSAWGFAGSDGLTSVMYGDEVACNVRAITDIGNFPADGFHELSPLTADGQTYEWTATLVETLPEIPASAVVSAPDSTYRWVIDYEVPGEVLVGFYNFDKPHKYTERLSSGNIDFFIVDEENFTLYDSAAAFDAHELTWQSDTNTVTYPLPGDETWTAVFTAERKVNCKQLLDVEFILQEFDGQDWVDLETITRSLELIPGERYLVSTEVPGSSVELGVNLTMPLNDFKPGDTCNLIAHLGNPGDAMTAIPLFVLLEAYGMYFSWPDWKQLPDLSWGTVDVPSGLSEVTIFPDFPWPDGVGSASGLMFYGAMTNATLSQLLGNMGTWEFGWSQ
jgi:Transglutaminase-like superfamily